MLLLIIDNQITGTVTKNNISYKYLGRVGRTKNYIMMLFSCLQIECKPELKVAHQVHEIKEHINNYS